MDSVLEFCGLDRVFLYLYVGNFKNTKLRKLFDWKIKILYYYINKYKLHI